MGGKSTSQNQQTQQSTTAPWTPAQGLLQGILSGANNQVGAVGITPQQSGALDTIEGNSQNFGQFSPAISDVIKSMLAGGGATDQAPNVQSNLDQYKSWLTPYANGSMMGGNTGLQPYLDTIRNDVTNQVNGQFAAAGRSFSPDNSMALARGIAQGEAPVIANQYNQDVGNRINAAGSLYGAGNTTSGLLSGLNQTSLANKGAGVGMIPQAVAAGNAAPQSILEAEAQRFGIPVQQLGLLAQIGIPIAGLGSQSTGTGTANTTNQMSGAQQFALIGQGLGGAGKFLFG